MSSSEQKAAYAASCARSRSHAQLVRCVSLSLALQHSWATNFFAAARSGVTPPFASTGAPFRNALNCAQSPAWTSRAAILVVDPDIRVVVPDTVAPVPAHLDAVTSEPDMLGEPAPVARLRRNRFGGVVIRPG